MIDLGQKPPDYEKLYPSSNKDKNKKNYNRITLPMAILDGKSVKKGDKITICLSCDVTGLRSDEYGNDLTLEVKEGEVESGAEDEGSSEEQTVLGATKE